MASEDADIRSSGAIEDVAVGMVVNIEMLLLCFLARRSRGYNYWRVTYQGSQAPDVPALAAADRSTLIWTEQDSAFQGHS